jgi:hypothetical protein
MSVVADYRRGHPVGGGITLLTYPHFVAKHVKVTTGAHLTGIWDHNSHYRNQGHRKLKSNMKVARYIDGVTRQFIR